jgi:biopolymer transport protein ExbD
MTDPANTPGAATGAEPPATMGEVKALIRKKLRGRGEHEHTGLNIYPMMDMMTILLVFMVMQFASSSAAVVTESEEMKLPYSLSTEVLQDATPVQLTRDSLLVAGRQVIPLRQGRIDPSYKQGGASSLVVPALQRRMCEVRDQRKALAALNPRNPFQGEVQVIADRRTPYRTITEVLYTLGQCEFSQLRFIVGRAPSPSTTQPAAP